MNLKKCYYITLLFSSNLKAIELRTLDNQINSPEYQKDLNPYFTSIKEDLKKLPDVLDEFGIEADFFCKISNNLDFEKQCDAYFELYKILELQISIQINNETQNLIREIKDIQCGFKKKCSAIRKYHLNFESIYQI